MSGKLIRSAPLGSRELLLRMFEEPNLVAAVQALPAPALGKLIEHIGLADAGEIVALATTDQIRRIFDDDLWRSERPGQDETFAADRFASWLEIMLEAGEGFAAEKLAELPEDLVTLALSKQVLVVDLDELAATLAPSLSDDDAMIEKALESCLCEEIDQYRIIARRHEGWDAVIGVLLALDRDHHELLARLLERCCYASNEHIEENGGLYHVLTAAEMLEADAAAEREDRRAEAGYVAPSSAAAFLALARTTPLAAIIDGKGRDPIAQAYFRSLRRVVAPTPTSKAAQPGGQTEATRLVELLTEAEVLPKAQAVALLEAPRAAAASATPDMLTEAMRQLHERSPADHDRRMEELAFVANALQAGASLEGRALRAAEAARLAVAVCNLGLEHLVHAKLATVTLALAGGHDRLFRIGWQLLTHDVSMPAARALLGWLAETRAPARTVAALDAAIATGKPWGARAKLLDLADGGRLTAWLGLIDECPHLDGVLAPAADADVAFIATQADLRAVQDFLSTPSSATGGTSAPRR